MSKRLVRIYKSPDGNGDYVNKTKAFLQKAQMGAEVQSAPNMNQYLQHIYEQLSNDVELDDVYAELIAAGVNKDAAYQMLNSVVTQMVDAGELNPDNQITKSQQEEAAKAQEEAEKEKQNQQQEEVQEEPDQATDYFNSYADEQEYSQPDLEFQDGGQLEYDEEEEEPESNLEYQQNNKNTEPEEDNKFVDEQYNYLNKSAQYPGLEDYYQGYVPLEWQAQDTRDFNTDFYKQGGSKKLFVKNVLKRLQEGGEEEQEASRQIGQGNRFDNANDQVSKLKENFINTVKEKANKAKLNDLYDKMMNSGKPDLIKTATTMSQNMSQSDEEGGEFYQTGGYVGEEQPEMFMYGGTELPFYEADFLPEAQEGKEVRKAKVTYVPNRVLPAETRFRIFNPAFGERKTYTGMPYNALTKEIYKDPLDELTPVARTVHKRGILGRPKQWTDYYSKGSIKQVPNTPGQEIKAAYEKAVAKDQKHGMSEELWDSLPAKAKRQIRRGERQLGREFERGVEQTRRQADFDKKSPEKYMYDSEKDLKRDLRNNGTDYSSPSPYEGIVIKTHDSKGKAYDLPRLVSVPELPEMSTLEDLIMNQYAQTSNSELPDVNSIEFPEYQPIKYENLKEFMPAKQETQDLSEMYPTTLHQFIQGKSKNTIAQEEAEREAQEAEEADMFEQSMIRSKRGFSYGGVLGKYQIAGAVKSPTNKLSAASDPTATSGNLVGMLKPQENPNTLMGSSASFMNQNAPTNPDAGKVKTVEMDPNQTKGQTITSEDFGKPANDQELIAQDYETKRDFDGMAFNNKINAAADMFTGFMGRLDSAKKEKEMYQNNFTSDNLYGASTNKDRGDYVAYGQQTGLFRPDQTGQETMGRFAYGQSGGYMQSGGYFEGDEVDMTEDELAEFLANGGEVEYLES